MTSEKYVIPGLVGASEADERHQFGLWMFLTRKDDNICPRCSACENVHCGRPTNYCPNCGAVMLNKIDAENHFFREYEEDHEEVEGL